MSGNIPTKNYENRTKGKCFTDPKNIANVTRESMILQVCVDRRRARNTGAVNMWGKLRRPH